MSPIEDDARRIAERGRDELVARLRPAFQQAAEAHADPIELGESELERMVQRAADEADGLQWRRALASVAMEELDLGLGPALGHPAVARAHQIIGAPSYEEAVARMGLPVASSEQLDERPELEEACAGVDEPTAEQIVPHGVAFDEGAAAEVAAQGAAEVAAQGAAEKAPAEARADEVPLELSAEQPERRPFPPAPIPARSGTPVRLVCTHLGGIADLASPEPGVELWFSEYGLDIIRPSKEPLGRLSWDELQSIEIVDARGRFALRRSPRSYLVIRGVQGDASFEVDGSRPELQDRLVASVGEKVPII